MGGTMGPITTSREDDKDANDKKGPGAPSPGTGDTDKTSEDEPEGTGETTKEGEKDELAKAQAEKEEALRIARAAHKEAESAKAYVATLTSTLKDSAERIAIGRGRTDGEEEPSLAERLQEDPEGVLDEHYQRRTAPIVKQYQANQAKLVRELAVNRLSTARLYEGGPTLWEKYGAEADEFLGQFDDAYRAAPDAYDAAIRWVRSQHIEDEIVEREKANREAEKRSFVESPSGGAAAPRRGTKRTLDDVERAVAKGLQLSEEEYLQYKEG